MGYGWAAIGSQVSSGLVFGVIGLTAASLYFTPESNTLREAWSRLKSRRSLLIYEGIVFAWVVLDLAFPTTLFLPFTLVLLSVATIYPTGLFLSARKRAKPTHVKNSMAMLSVTWALFVTVGTLLFALGTQPPVFPVSVPYGWEFGFISGSVLFFLMSTNDAFTLSAVRFSSGQLIPETIVKPGHRYLILHDSGKRAMSFLSSTLKGLIDSGARVIINASNNGWLVGNLSAHESRFNEWKQNGRVVVSENHVGHNFTHEGISDRFTFGPTSTVFVNELSPENLEGTVSSFESGTEKNQEPAELFLLESSKAPRPQLTEFLHRNNGIELLNLSESTDQFSSLVDLDHQKIRGSIILMEYETSSDYEQIVDKFLAEGISNAELCVLFTTKSSKLYRAIKGKRMIKIIAASSLISVPDELPDGEMQIPDKELGLVAAVLSDFIDNSKNSGASFVFDSITELIRGERWEQVYSGIKQLIDLLSVPNATALFLANINTMEPRFLGALHGAFALQLRLDSQGLKAVKVPVN